MPDGQHASYDVQPQFDGGAHSIKVRVLKAEGWVPKSRLHRTRQYFVELHYGEPLFHLMTPKSTAVTKTKSLEWDEELSFRVECGTPCDLKVVLLRKRRRGGFPKLVGSANLAAARVQAASVAPEAGWVALERPPGKKHAAHAADELRLLLRLAVLPEAPLSLLPHPPPPPPGALQSPRRGGASGSAGRRLSSARRTLSGALDAVVGPFRARSSGPGAAREEAPGHVHVRA
eukprot:tig00000241_g21002.t1